jgi:hypothetical protein
LQFTLLKRQRAGTTRTLQELIAEYHRQHALADFMRVRHRDNFATAFIRTTLVVLCAASLVFIPARRLRNLTGRELSHGAGGGQKMASGENSLGQRSVR